MDIWVGFSEADEGQKEETLGRLRIQQVSGEETDSKPFPQIVLLYTTPGEGRMKSVRGLCLLELLCWKEGIGNELLLILRDNPLWGIEVGNRGILESRLCKVSLQVWSYLHTMKARSEIFRFKKTTNRSVVPFVILSPSLYPRS